MVPALYYLKDAMVRLKKFHSNTAEEITKNKKINLDDKKNTLLGLLLDTLMALEECVHVLNNENYYTAIKSSVQLVLNTLIAQQDINNIQTSVEIILNCAKDIVENHFYDYMKFDYEINVNRKSFIEDISLKSFVESIKDPGRAINIIEVNGSSGTNIRHFVASKLNCNYYVITSKEKKPNFIEFTKKIALGTTYNSKISNNVFDIVITQPDLELNRHDRLINSDPNELLMIKNTIKYLRDDGIYVLILPYYKFYKKICNFLAKNLRDVQIRLSPGYYQNTHVILTGYKKTDKELDQDVYSQLRYLFDKKSISSEEPFAEHILPPNELEITVFRGGVIDEEELMAYFPNSPSMQSFWKKQNENQEDKLNKRPLLPFNIGQLGLVLTSGCLDGIVDEGNGCYHVVKGRITKKTINDEDDSQADNTYYTETNQNVVEIHLMLANGNHKVLV